LYLSFKIFNKRKETRGNGATVVLERGRVAARKTVKIFARTLSSKAGPSKIHGALRGSEAGANPVRDGKDEKVYKKDREVGMNIKSIANLKNLVTAYEMIKSRPGNMTTGVGNDTLDGLNKEYLLRLQKKLRDGKYKFPPARRIQIPKPGKTETRPLTIASPRDKVVQKAMELVLNQHFDPLFLDSSHGFRPGRGTHTAIRQLDAKFQSVHYVIEADFSKAFDRIPHKILMETLKKQITCPKTLALIQSGLEAGFVERGKFNSNFGIGTPQGSVLSPLLCNIFFHELDVFMSKLSERYNIGEKRQANPEYVKIQSKFKTARRNKLNNKDPKAFSELICKLLRTPSKAHNDSYTRVHYIRYADDFVVGVEGSYTITQTILEEIKTFLATLELSLNEDKTRITRFNAKPIDFLGYTIMSPHLKDHEKPFEIYRGPKNTAPFKRRKKLRIRFFMNQNRVLLRMANNKYTRKDRTGRWRGTNRGNLLNMEHADILRYYNAVIRGIHNYYDFVNNMARVAQIIWLLEESCGLTLAKKYKLKSLRAVYRKFGKDLGVTIKDSKGTPNRISLKKPTSFSRVPITKHKGLL